MAVYTIGISACSGGNHITATIKKDNVAVNQLLYTKQAIMDGIVPDKGTLEDVVIWLMRNAIKKAGATTPAQMKAAVEAATWEF